MKHNPIANTTRPSRRVMMVAGEASGDFHGANLIRHLQADNNGPPVEIFGIGGRAMARAGMSVLVDAARLSVVGITEVLRRLPRIIAGMITARQALRDRRPDLLILIDFPDFNLWVAKQARKYKIPVFYYITPQVWAWRRQRVKTIQARVDRVAVIFPFEETFFREHGVPATFVGHPLLDAGYDDRAEPAAAVQAAPGGVIALLPGSRNKEIQRHLPLMLAAAEKIQQQLPRVRFLISCSDFVEAEALAQITDRYYDRISYKIVPGPVAAVLSASSAALAVSGTVTLEAALFEVPTVIIYRVSALSYGLGKALISVPYLSLVNIVAETEIVPELIQSEATPTEMARQICLLMTDQGRYQKMRDDLRRLREKLGGPGASARAAGIALEMLADT